jgi:hypothetical protein
MAATTGVTTTTAPSVTAATTTAPSSVTAATAAATAVLARDVAANLVATQKEAQSTEQARRGLVILPPTQQQIAESANGSAYMYYVKLGFTLHQKEKKTLLGRSM